MLEKGGKSHGEDDLIYTLFPSVRHVPQVSDICLKILQDLARCCQQPKMSPFFWAKILLRPQNADYKPTVFH